MKPVSIAVLVDDSDRALMLHRHRWVTDEIGYEFLGGLIEPGEDPADTARARPRRRAVGVPPAPRSTSPRSSRCPGWSTPPPTFTCGAPSTTSENRPTWKKPASWSGSR
ncbi:NUDIX hydrolase [Pseudonocardia sp. Ae717_Ps2]|uniref:NUDIX hydrolase n=1 Tax=Pseudonocardia sp. Ae717_Ps2 TaxID=1885573 RepID=UPI003510B580